MRKNYKLNINPKIPSREEINKHKDFEGLLNKYRKTVAQKNQRTRVLRIVSFSAAIAAAIATFIIINLQQEPIAYQEKAIEYFEHQDFINPPLAEIEVPFSQQKVNARTGGTIENETGSKLVIPSYAFVNDRGKLIEGDVDIRYREFHDFIDFFIAGIPMTYDSSGSRYILESAGMIEVYAQKDGERLNIAPQKSIEVELVSHILVPSFTVLPNYYVYQLDTANRNWIYKDVDQIELLDPKVSEVQAEDPLSVEQQKLFNELGRLQNEYDQKILALENSVPKPFRPIQPLKKSSNNPTFELDFSNPSPSAEAKQNPIASTNTNLDNIYDGTIWQINDQSLSKLKELKAISQSGADSQQIRQLNEHTYELTLITEDQQLKLIISPVLTGNDYDQAMDAFQKSLEQYNALLAAWEDQLGTQKETLLAELEASKKTAQLAFEQLVDSLQAQNSPYLVDVPSVKRRVLNRFQANSFGVWNCDRPLAHTNSTRKINFRDQKGSKFERHTAYLADKNHNTVYQFFATDGSLLPINQDSEKLLWIVSEENKLSVFRPEDFEIIEENQEEYTFVLNTVDQSIDNEETLRSILQF